MSKAKEAPTLFGSCTCLTKTPEWSYHALDCDYRKLMEAHIDEKVQAVPSAGHGDNDKE